jgi:transcriptional regulator with XRE-family HTH domain
MAAPNPPDTIQQTVATRAAELGVTGAELARRSGVSRQHCCDYLSGRKGMTDERLGRILQALGLELRPAGRRVNSPA